MIKQKTNKQNGGFVFAVEVAMLLYLVYSCVFVSLLQAFNMEAVKKDCTFWHRSYQDGSTPIMSSSQVWSQPERVSLQIWSNQWMWCSKSTSCALLFQSSMVQTSQDKNLTHSETLTYLCLEPYMSFFKNRWLVSTGVKPNKRRKGTWWNISPSVLSEGHHGIENLCDLIAFPDAKLVSDCNMLVKPPQSAPISQRQLMMSWTSPNGDVD